jgi:hypothetical protein
LYAGGERPFFEDIESSEPTVYMIHNLLTLSECKLLIQPNPPSHQHNTMYRPMDTYSGGGSGGGSGSGGNRLQYLSDSSLYEHTDRRMVYTPTGLFHNTIFKAMDERMEQVTGFPAVHFSEWIVDRVGVGSTIQPHYDTLPGGMVPHATITVFLSDWTTTDTSTSTSTTSSPLLEGGEIVYPRTSGNSYPILIRPVQGLAIVHHNTNEQHELETNSLHAMLPITRKTTTTTTTTTTDGGDDTPPQYLYIARKYILPTPISNVRRAALPWYVIVFGGSASGTIPYPLVQCHFLLTTQLGNEIGNQYFDHMLIGLPIVLVVLILAVIGQQIHQQMQRHSSNSNTAAAATATTAVSTSAAAAAASSSSSSSSRKHTNKKENSTMVRSSTSMATAKKTKKKN